MPPTEELILERLLAGLLERGGGAAEGDVVETPPDLAELRDVARRLRASVQWMPLPRSRLALRRALLATVEAARSRPAARQQERYMPAAWRRTGRWLTAVTAATFLAIGAVMGAHALEMAFSPSGALYALALQMDAVRVQLAGDAMHRAATLVEVTRDRAAEIGAMAYGDDPRGVEEAAAALERQNQWLRSVARSLPAADQRRLAPAAAKSDTLVMAARRAAQLRMRGLLPSGVTMSDLLSAGSGPLSGAATTDISTPTAGSRERSSHGGESGAGASGGASGRDTSGAPARRESTDSAATGGHSGADAGTAGASRGGSSASDGTSRGGASTGAASESHKNGGGGDAAPGSAGSGAGASSGSQSGASSGDQRGSQGGSAQGSGASSGGSQGGSAQGSGASSGGAQGGGAQGSGASSGGAQGGSAQGSGASSGGSQGGSSAAGSGAQSGSNANGHGGAQGSHGGNGGNGGNSHNGSDRSNGSHDSHGSAGGQGDTNGDTGNHNR